MKYGYARVSTLDQDTALQLTALRSAGCKTIYEEKRSATKNRPELQALLSNICRGDELVIYKLDRLARSLRDLLNIVERLEQRGATLRSLTEPINHDTAAGRMMLQLLGVFAEFERNLIRERTMAGQLEALRNGRLIGRPSRIPLHHQREIICLRDAGKSVSEIARVYGVSANTVYRLYNEATGRKPRQWGELRTLFYRDKIPQFPKGCYQNYTELPEI